MSYQTFDATPGALNESALENSDEGNNPLFPFGKPVKWSNTRTQMVFIRKTYTLFTFQLLTVSIASLLFLRIEDWRLFVVRHLWLWGISLLSTFLLLVGLTYKSNDEFQPPIFLVLVYTFVDAYTIAGFIAVFKIEPLLDALILTTVGGIAIWIFTLQIKLKYRTRNSIKFAISMIIVAGVIMHPLLFPLLDGLIAVPIAISLTVFFILDSWYLMQTLSATECWAAAMQLHLDLVVPLKSLHHMCEISATD
ncbi:9327_t:CDS:2 [Paraglomus brasilianum]|uniref:9327_t:CDS:1 n=1 Tax=Paraglomus brasilianum TaxID=144538 RepID=A0A9N9CIB2_9GLOM|nr:9327_t:CDS:2 [Paraglomus brasilianum]